jgi:two-component system response regulator
MTASPSRLDRKLILLVEDDPDHVILARRAIHEMDLAPEIVVANDGAEALDYLFGTSRPGESTSRAIPQVVVLDLKLPKIGGLEVLRRIRADERTRLLPIVILTSSDEERDLIDGYRLGANSYVRKPVDFDEFVEAAKQLGLYWLKVNDPPPGLRWAS